MSLYVLLLHAVQAIVECVVNLKFSQIEHLWRVFWHGGDLNQDSLAR